VADFSTTGAAAAAGAPQKPQNFFPGTSGRPHPAHTGPADKAAAAGSGTGAAGTA